MPLTFGRLIVIGAHFIVTTAILIVNVLLSTQVPPRYKKTQMIIVSAKEDWWHFRGEPYLLLSLIAILVCPLN